MTKSVIGFYSEPLTQEERDTIYNHFTPIYNQYLTDEIVNHIAMLADKVFNHSKGAVSESLLIETMNNDLARSIKEYLITYHPNLTELKDIKAEFKWIGKGSVTVEYDPFFTSLVRKETTLTYPGPFYERVMVKNYNRYLHDHPEKRIFTPSKRAYKIDAANTALLKRLEESCYESQNSSEIFDFSDILETLIK